jgi:hypothetical protein
MLLAGMEGISAPRLEQIMYPSSFEPIEHTDYEHVEPIEERHATSSWKTWVIVMLAIAAFVLVFMTMGGDPEAATPTTQVLPNTPAG